MEFGGLGGIQGGREVNPEDLFEQAVNTALGDAIRSDDDMAAKMWAALANQDWQHEDGHMASYSFRAAGDLVAAIRGNGDYMDWYCSHDYPYAGEDITGPMLEQGWMIMEDNVPDYKDDWPPKRGFKAGGTIESFARAIETLGQTRFFGQYEPHGATRNDLWATPDGNVKVWSGFGWVPTGNRLRRLVRKVRKQA